MNFSHWELEEPSKICSKTIPEVPKGTALVATWATKEPPLLRPGRLRAQGEEEEERI